MPNTSFENTTPHYIDGQFVGSNGDLFSSLNPIDSTPIWQGRKAQLQEAEFAYNAAATALKHWALLGFDARKDYVLKFGKIIEKRQDELVELIAKETGKPLWEALTEVNAILNKIPLSIRAYEERTPEKKIISHDSFTAVGYKPQGVVAVLGPFNFPAHLSNGHIVPALLAGNTIIYKPSELTPLVAQFIIECWHTAGLPKGVINCIQGDAGTAKALLTQNIQALYFTGSYKAGLQIHQAFATRPDVLLALEMGGNNPLIIDTIDDIKTAVYYTLLSSYITAGQRCTCARRLLIKNDSFGDAFLQQLTIAAKNISVGAYTTTPEPFMGPVIGYDHALLHLNAQQALYNQGGNSILKMSLIKEHSGLLTPGIVDMSNVSNPNDEEIFAPLIQVYRYQQFEEALELANQTKYGLIAGLIGNNSTHFDLFYQTIRSGIVHWNKPTTNALSSLPFGGSGQSGNHRPSGYYAADYCAYPVAIQEVPHLMATTPLLPGIYI